MVLGADGVERAVKHNLELQAAKSLALRKTYDVELLKRNINEAEKHKDWIRLSEVKMRLEIVQKYPRARVQAHDRELRAVNAEYEKKHTNMMDAWHEKEAYHKTRVLAEKDLVGRRHFKQQEALEEVLFTKGRGAVLGLKKKELREAQAKHDAWAKQEKRFLQMRQDRDKGWLQDDLDHLEYTFEHEKMTAFENFEQHRWAALMEADQAFLDGKEIEEEDEETNLHTAEAAMNQVTEALDSTASNWKTVLGALTVENVVNAPQMLAKRITAGDLPDEEELDGASGMAGVDKKKAMGLGRRMTVNVSKHWEKIREAAAAQHRELTMSSKDRAIAAAVAHSESDEEESDDEEDIPVWARKKKDGSRMTKEQLQEERAKVAHNAIAAALNEELNMDEGNSKTIVMGHYDD